MALTKRQISTLFNLKKTFLILAALGRYLALHHRYVPYEVN